MAIGIFGGTFDPVHLGHLRVAEEIRERFDLEKVLFIPVNNPPHKQGRRISDGEVRSTMLKIATQGNRFLHLSRMELERGGISYSIETIKELERKTEDLLFIIGVDAFSEIHTWKSYQELFYHANFAVMVRPSEKSAQGVESLPEDVRPYVEETKDGHLEHRSGRKIFFCHVTQLDISSTKIRELVRTNRSIRYLVSRGVEKYITERGLYKH
jgi:nicotinate-nucleotide adenylyltransferase